MVDEIKISDQSTAVFLISLKNEGKLQLTGTGWEDNRLWISFSPKSKALSEIQKMENMQSEPLQPKRFLDSLAEFKNILRREKNQL